MLLNRGKRRNQWNDLVINTDRSIETDGWRIVSSHSQPLEQLKQLLKKFQYSFSMQARILYGLVKTQSLKNKINAPFALLKPQDNLNPRKRGKTAWQHCQQGQHMVATGQGKLVHTLQILKAYQGDVKDARKNLTDHSYLVSLWEVKLTWSKCHCWHFINLTQTAEAQEAKQDVL